ncbi:MAG: toxin-antitoxin system HicB family antitoxin [Nocardiopsaceae bacterium]|jgi:predicted transcriptional regulator|nr:toxin-antitoxin system HicB family antitoxin [Nocardiopsaceae bacterium]
MELSPYVEGLRSELGSLTRFASDDVVQVADKLAEALDSSVRLTLLEVLSAAAAEITTRLDDAVIDVRLNGGEPEFVITTVEHAEQPAAPTAETADDAGTARVTLRLSEALKARVEAQAASDGLSVNSWLAHAAIRALEGPRPGRGPRSRGGIGQTITGYARS